MKKKTRHDINVMAVSSVLSVKVSSYPGHLDLAELSRKRLDSFFKIEVQLFPTKLTKMSSVLLFPHSKKWPLLISSKSPGQMGGRGDQTCSETRNIRSKQWRGLI